MKLEGSVAIVTGAAGGIGFAVSQRLLEAGASVVLADLRGTDDAIERLLGQHAGRVEGLDGDVGDEKQILALIELAESRFGPVDLYVANAGVGLSGGLAADDDTWATSWHVNVMAHVRAARLLMPGWLERGTGYFLSTASAAGLLTQIGSATYSVTKHGAVAFAEWLRVTYGHKGIAVSCLCPMGVATAMLQGDDADHVGAKAVTSAGDVLTPRQVAEEVVAAIHDERFLILPHPEVLDFYRRKASDYERWIRGMQRYQDTLEAGA